jgi:non-heme chloroperoxidase
MGTITTTDDVEIFYKDWGSGQPIVFSHGWPLSADDWDTQMLFFLSHGYRVIAADRRWPRHGPPDGSMASPPRSLDCTHSADIGS